MDEKSLYFSVEIKKKIAGYFFLSSFLLTRKIGCEKSITLIGHYYVKVKVTRAWSFGETSRHRNFRLLSQEIARQQLEFIQKSIGRRYIRYNSLNMNQTSLVLVVSLEARYTGKNQKRRITKRRIEITSSSSGMSFDKMSLLIFTFQPM